MTRTPQQKLMALVEEAEKASAGPWISGDARRVFQRQVRTRNFRRKTVTKEMSHVVCHVGVGEVATPDEIASNLQFIAHSRTTVPILARTLLAVMEMCNDHAPNIGCMSYVTPIDPNKLRQVITDGLKEME